MASGGTTLALLLVVGLISAWAAWFLGADVALYAVSEGARPEMSQAAYPVEASIAGRVVASHLVLGQEVQAGEVLVDLDATAQQLQLEEAQASVRALTSQLGALHTAIAAEEPGRGRYAAPGGEPTRQRTPYAGERSPSASR